MASIDGNNILYMTLNGRRVFIDRAFEAGETGPDWLPDKSGLNTLLDNITGQSNYYVDIAYQFMSAVGGRTHIYYRCFASSDITARLEKPDNFYSVFQNPYQPSYRGWTTYAFYYGNNGGVLTWWLSSTTSNQDRAQTENKNGSFSHKAIINPTFTTFTNGTGETWEEYV